MGNPLFKYDRSEELSKLAKALDDAREAGLDSLQVAEALAAAMWETHGFNFHGSPEETEGVDLEAGINDFTDAFLTEVKKCQG